MGRSRIVRGTRSFSRRPGKPGTWSRLSDTETLTAGAKTLAATATLSTSFNETVRRVIVDLSHSSDQVSATENYQGAMGLCVVSDAAVTAGAASIPGPLTDLDDDLWLMWFGFQGGVTVGATAGDVTAIQANVHQESRAMRRVQEGQQVAVMFEADAGGGIFLHYSMSLYSTFAT